MTAPLPEPSITVEVVAGFTVEFRGVDDIETAEACREALMEIAGVMSPLAGRTIIVERTLAAWRRPNRRELSLRPLAAGCVWWVKP